MTSAGYIHDQSCPVDPTHGDVLLPHGSFDKYHCPHVGHTPPDIEQHTKSIWTYEEWETAKRGQTQTKSPTTQAPHPSRAVAVKAKKKKSNVRANRRRSR